MKHFTQYLKPFALILFVAGVMSGLFSAISVTRMLKMATGAQMSDAATAILERYDHYVDELARFLGLDDLVAVIVEFARHHFSLNIHIYPILAIFVRPNRPLLHVGRSH